MKAALLYGPCAKIIVGGKGIHALSSTSLRKPCLRKTHCTCESRGPRTYLWCIDSCIFSKPLFGQSVTCNYTLHNAEQDYCPFHSSWCMHVLVVDHLGNGLLARSMTFHKIAVCHALIPTGIQRNFVRTFCSKILQQLLARSLSHEIHLACWVR